MTDQKKQAITALIEDIKSSDLDLPSIDLLQFGVMLLKAKERADKAADDNPDQPDRKAGQDSPAH